MIQKYKQRDKKNPPLPQNAVGRLNDRFRNLTYEIIKQDGPTHNAYFTMALRLQGQVFVGTGKTKRDAKKSCAEKALVYMGMEDKESLNPLNRFLPEGTYKGDEDEPMGDAESGMVQGGAEGEDQSQGQHQGPQGQSEDGSVPQDASMPQKDEQMDPMDNNAPPNDDKGGVTEAPTGPTTRSGARGSRGNRGSPATGRGVRGGGARGRGGRGGGAEGGRGRGGRGRGGRGM